MENNTNRKRAEAALAESEARLRAIVQSEPECVKLIDADGNLLDMNPAGLRMIEADSLEQVKGKPLLGLVAPEHRAAFKKLNDRVFAGEPGVLEFEIVGLKGAHRWMETHAVPLRDSENKVISLLGITRDITERKRVEAESLQSYSLLQAAFESTADGLLVVDTGGKVTGFNQRFVEMWRIPDSIIASRDDDQALAFVQDQLQNPDAFIHKVRELYAQPDAESFDLLEFKDGRIFERYSQPQRSGEKVVGRVWSFRDATAGKRAEEALRASEGELRALFEAIPDVILVVDKDGRYVKVAPTRADHLHYLPEENLIGRKMHDIFSRQKADEFIRYIHQALETGKPVQFEYALLIEDHIAWFLGATAPFTTDTVIWVARDITPQKQAEEQVQRRLTDLEVLYESGLSMSSSLEPRIIAQKIINVLSKRLDWHHAAVRVRREDSDEVELLAFSEAEYLIGQDKAGHAMAKNAITRVGEGLSGWVIKHARTINSGDLQNDPRYHETFPGMRSGLYVPIWSGGRALGCISVESVQREAFSEDDERLLTTLASQAAAALENARLFSLERLRRQDAEMLRQAASALASSLDPQKVLNELLGGLSRVIAFDSATVFIQENEKMRAVSGRGLAHPERVIGHLFPNNDTITKMIFETHRPVVIEDVSKDGIFEDWGTEQLVRGWMGVPLIVRGEVVGYLSVDRKLPIGYTEADAEMAMAFANQAAAAIENARLFQEAQRAAERQSVLYQVSQDIARHSQGSEQLYDAIYKAAQQLMPADMFTIALINEAGNQIDGVCGMDRGVRYPVVSFPLGAGIAGRVIETKKTLLLDDYDESSGVSRIRFSKEGGTRSVLAVPLRSREKVIGAMSVQSYQPRQYAKEDSVLLEMLGAQVAVAIENARLFEQISRRVDQLSALHTVDAAIGSTTDLRVSLQAVLEGVTRQLNVDAAAVLLLNPATLILQYAAGSGFHTSEITRASLAIGKGRAGTATLERRIIRIPDLAEAGIGFARSTLVESERFAGYMAVPLIAKGEVKGVLELFHRSPLDLDAERTSYLETLAEQAALAIDNALLFESLEKANIEMTMAYDATIRGWSQALELRDQETQGHSVRVLELTLRLAAAMRLPDKDLQDVRRGVLLHDIGKMGIPDSILHKPGPLTDEEWKIMRRHPQFAYDMLSPIAYLRGALDIPYCHHEKWDGSGYPRALKGETIPITARIFAVVDVYDALTSDRSYRKAWSKEKTLDYIISESGKHFDPRVVEAFLDLIKS